MKTHPLRRATGGFTLIELMLVVAIIGVLASVAMPALTVARYRSQAAERATLLDGISRGAADVVGGQQRIPGALGATIWAGAPNPPGVPGQSKRIFQQGMAAWVLLPLLVQGSCYYSYSFQVIDETNNGATAEMSVTAEGDLDSDGLLSTKTINYRAEGYVFRKLEPEVPPAGQEDQGTF